MPLTPPPSSTRSASSIARHHTDEPPSWLARNRWPPRGRQGYRVAGGSRARRPVMSEPARSDGRLRALYAAATGTLETASLGVKAVWLICVLVLAAIVVGILAGLLDAVL